MNIVVGNNYTGSATRHTAVSDKVGINYCVKENQPQCKCLCVHRKLALHSDCCHFSELCKKLFSWIAQLWHLSGVMDFVQHLTLSQTVIELNLRYNIIWGDCHKTPVISWFGIFPNAINRENKNLIYTIQLIFFCFFYIET